MSFRVKILIVRNDVKILIVLSESPLKISKIAVNRFLISLSSSKAVKVKRIAKQSKKNGTTDCAVMVKSTKIDRICDVMSWTSGSEFKFTMSRQIIV